MTEINTVEASKHWKDEREYLDRIEFVAQLVFPEPGGPCKNSGFEFFFQFLIDETSCFICFSWPNISLVFLGAYL